MPGLTREEMKEQIALGRSILFSPTEANPGGKQALTEADLPTEAEMAIKSDDPAKKEAAAADLERRMDQMAAELAALRASQPPAKPQAEPAKAAEPAHSPAPARPVAPAAPAAPKAPEKK